MPVSTSVIPIRDANQTSKRQSFGSVFFVCHFISDNSTEQTRKNIAGNEKCNFFVWRQRMLVHPLFLRYNKRIAYDWEVMRKP